jgi:trimeric autotransporter adhesin
MFTKSFKNISFITTIFVLTACGGGGDTSIASPGELGSLDDPIGGGGTGGSSSNVLTGSCPESEFITNGSPVAGNTVCAIEGPITGELTLTNDVMYRMLNKVDVGVDMGGDGTKAGGVSGTLTIPAGVVIMGKTSNDYLVVNRGSKLIANGTRSKPIRFTHNTAIEGTVGELERGLWGGIVILGKAPINKCSNDVRGTAACESVVEGSDALMGGATPGDNSGKLNFVRVEYAGYEIFPGNELNGITFGGVGYGTEVDYVQVHNNQDDCVEFFGGTVNVKHLICTNAGDDNLDIDWGYQGKMQFVVVKQSSDTSDHVVESDNTNADSAVGFLTEPRSRPMVANFTFLAQGADEPLKYKEGVSGIYINGIVVNANSQNLIESTNLETIQDGALTPKLQHHSIFMDSAGDTSPFKADTDSSGVTAAQLEASLKERATDLVLGTNTLVSGMFLGDAEEAVVSAFNGSKVQAMCAVGPHSAGTPTELCPTYSSIEGRYIVDTWFSATDYIGAFSPGSDIENNWASGWTIGLFTAPECPNGTLESEVLLGKKVCSLSGEVIEDITLVAGNYYKLDGKVAIGKDMGADGTKTGGVSAKLSIEPGVTIFGESGNDYLVVMRGSDIHAVGTSSAPIVMTGRQDILGEADIVNTRGLWGGLVILGQAPINKCSFSTAGSSSSAGTRVNPCEKEVEGSSGDTMGGELPNDSSGSLKYVRVQYAGYEVFPGNELNGITFGGVGNGTVVDYIQVHNNQDDCVEFFGGTVDVKRLICTGAGDDNLDIDWGYQGRMQYVLVQQSNGVGDHIVESDNTNADAAVAYLTEPRSNPIVSNFTFLSSGKDEIFKLKEGVSGQYYNGVAVVKDGSTNCIETTFAETAQDGAVTPHFSMNSVAMECNGFVKTDGLATVASIEAIVKEGANNLYGANSGSGSYVNTLSGPVNGSSESAATVTTIPDKYNADGFFDTTDYIGAIKGATDTWYKNWTLSGTIDVQ